MTFRRGEPPPPRPRNGPAKQRKRPPPSPSAFAYTIDDAVSMGLVSQSRVYNLIKSGELETVKLGGRTLVTGASVRRLLGVPEPFAEPVDDELRMGA